ncbi:hypothetical protein AB5J55_11475 [Streptomyces sp. R11]|uniref:Transmembrane protein n=1 Tax=Streptomyces sp. R11 TaxID=3238625 RepID=A0AB39MYL6_9ACTN
MTSPETQTQHVRQTAPPEAGTQGGEKHTGGKVMHLHTAHPRVPIPYVTPGDMFSRDMLSGARKATSTATSAAASTASTAMAMLPSPRKLAFYGVLGGMTAAGAMAWPVAVAVGAATEVITREQAARHHQDHESMARQGTGSEQSEQATESRTRPS